MDANTNRGVSYDKEENNKNITTKKQKDKISQRLLLSGKILKECETLEGHLRNTNQNIDQIVSGWFLGKSKKQITHLKANIDVIFSILQGQNGEYGLLKAVKEDQQMLSQLSANPQDEVLNQRIKKHWCEIVYPQLQRLLEHFNQELTISVQLEKEVKEKIQRAATGPIGEYIDKVDELEKEVKEELDEDNIKEEKIEKGIATLLVFVEKRFSQGETKEEIVEEVQLSAKSKGKEETQKYVAPVINMKEYEDNLQKSQNSQNNQEKKSGLESARELFGKAGANKLANYFSEILGRFAKIRKEYELAIDRLNVSQELDKEQEEINFIIKNFLNQVRISNNAIESQKLVLTKALYFFLVSFREKIMNKKDISYSQKFGDFIYEFSQILSKQLTNSSKYNFNFFISNKNDDELQGQVKEIFEFLFAKYYDRKDNNVKKIA